MSSSNVARKASHAGSWYSGNPRELDRQLSDWLAAVEQLPESSARVIISPHAGYSYCGSTAAYAFKQLVPENISTIFVLGPSHVTFLDSCAITTRNTYCTPLGDLQINTKINDELKETGAFHMMETRPEEREHSIEMQLPYIAKIMEKRTAGSYNIVPILVGSLTPSVKINFGKIFARYICNPRIAFVVSSDFCHWGTRFHFAPYDDSSNVPLYEQITSLDKEGMDAISSLDPNVFNEYLKRTQNTICGRNPIGIMLYAAQYYQHMNSHSAKLVFLKYSQSNQCETLGDSSVSYAAGALFFSTPQ